MYQSSRGANGRGVLRIRSLATGQDASSVRSSTTIKARAGVPIHAGSRSKARMALRTALGASTLLRAMSP